MADYKPVVIYIELDDGSMVEIELVKKSRPSLKAKTSK